MHAYVVESRLHNVVVPSETISLWPKIKPDIFFLRKQILLLISQYQMFYVIIHMSLSIDSLAVDDNP